MSADSTGAETAKISKQDSQCKQQEHPITTNTTSKMRRLINEAFTVYEFRKTVFSRLSAYEVAKLSCSFGIVLDDRERKKYLNIARDIFPDTRLIDKLIAQGVAITLMGSNLRILTRRLQDPNWYEKMRADRLHSLRKKTNDSSRELRKHRIWVAVIAPMPPARGTHSTSSSSGARSHLEDIEIPGEWSPMPWWIRRTEIFNRSGPDRPTDKLTLQTPVDVTFRVDRFIGQRKNTVFVSGPDDHTLLRVPSLSRDSLAVEYIRLHRDPFVVSKQQQSTNMHAVWNGLNRHKLKLILLPLSSMTGGIFPIPIFDCCSLPGCQQEQGERLFKVIDCCRCKGRCQAARQDPLPLIPDPWGIKNIFPNNPVKFESRFLSHDREN